MKIGCGFRVVRVGANRAFESRQPSLLDSFERIVYMALCVCCVCFKRPTYRSFASVVTVFGGYDDAKLCASAHIE